MAVKFVPLDLLSHESVRAAVELVKDVTDHIDILINNAGVMATRKFVLSDDQVESQFAANYLSHFLLTNLLLKNGLIKTGGLILNVGSLGYQMADIEYTNINFSVCHSRLLTPRIQADKTSGRRNLQRLESLRTSKIRATTRHARPCKTLERQRHRSAYCASRCHTGELFACQLGN